MGRGGAAVRGGCLGRWAARPPAGRAETMSVSKANIMSTPDPNVTTSRNDPCRTGAYLAETKLRPANVNRATFGRVYERHVEGDLLAQILYVRGVRGTPRGTKNLF